ncbi:MAG: 3-deoxy-manno-octulosonate cytidylyltransferase [Acidobacteriota bacterium]
MIPSSVPHRILGVIPARYASSRFPGKSLVSIAGKTMLQHVWERASQARYLTSVVIATDDERIRANAQSFGARVVMTREDHLSGTDRVAEVASASDAYWVVNIQGDEPTLDPAAIDATILGMMDQEGDTEAPMGTLKTPILSPAVVKDPNVVKVVTDQRGYAIYFSRSPIPYVREPNQGGEAFTHYKHIGLYIYQREFLLAYPDFPVGPLEQAERLEQLRALENGFRIRVVETDYDSIGIDTPEDYQHVMELFERTTIQN